MPDFIENANKSSAVAKYKALLASSDPKVKAAVAKAKEGFLRAKSQSGTIHVDATLANLSIQYRNEDYIGLELMPVVTVDKLGGKYFKYGKDNILALPDASVGSRSTPNEISTSRTNASYATDPYALKDFVSDDDVMASDVPLNLMAESMAAVNDQLDLAEEVRIATVVQTSGNYSGNTTALSGGSKWDAGSSNPVKDIQDALAAIWMGNGSTKLVASTSVDVFNVLSRHPAILDLFKYTGKGLATADMIAGFFGIDKLLIGKARKPTANAGQTQTYGRVWANSFSINRVATSPSTRTACFGLTFRAGQKKSFSWYDMNPGVGGGYWNKVGMHETHDVVAGDTGFLITGCIA
jgi:hypothetical protein